MPAYGQPIVPDADYVAYQEALIPEERNRPRVPRCLVRSVVDTGDSSHFIAGLMVILKLHERGLVNLDAPLTYNPRWIAPNWVETWKREFNQVNFDRLTMRKVLSRVCESFGLQMPTSYDFDYVASVSDHYWLRGDRLVPSIPIAPFINHLSWNDGRFPWSYVLNSDQWTAINTNYRQHGRNVVDWRLWEICKIASDGVQVPWHNDLPPIADHFARVSLDPKQAGMILFYPDANKAERGILTAMRPGRYLTRYYSDRLDAKAIQAMQALVDNASTVQFATSEADVVRVYIYGPRSCMANGKDIYTKGNTTPWGAPIANDKWYVGDVHPAAVYAESPDLQLAYMCDAKGRPNARVLVWPDRKIYGRVYGDEHRIIPRLEAMGYRRGGLHGARIRRIPVNSGVVVMPYIDDAHSFGEHDDKFYVIGGEYMASNTNGIAYLEAMVECCECGDDVGEENAICVNGAYYCEDCANSNFDFCDYTYEYCREAVDVVRGVCSYGFRYARCNVDCVDDYAFYCDRLNEYFDRGRYHPVEMANGDIWSSYAFDKYGVEIDGQRYPADDVPAELSDRA